MSLSNKISKDALKPGDHIYTWRNGGLYAHHGIYIGNGKAIHYTNEAGEEVGTGTFLDGISSSSSSSSSSRLHKKFPCGVCGDQSKKSGVILSCLDCFLKGDELYLYMYGVGAMALAMARGGTCTRALSDPPEDVVYRATTLLKRNGFGSYNLLNNNCEDFAIYCKTEAKASDKSLIGTSGQCKTGAIVAGTTTGVVVAAAVGAAVGALYKVLSDNGRRRDVKKVSVESLVMDTHLDPPVDRRDHL